MAKYKWCVWAIYDESLGDPEHNIAPGTKFEDLPDDWVCPECGIGKENFKKFKTKRFIKKKVILIE